MAMSVVYANIGGEILCENRGGTVSYYATDCQGSTMALVDETGAVTDRYDYWSYGEERVHTGSSLTRFTFLGIFGYVRDLLNKLYYVRARYLRPELARWQTVDPLWPASAAYTYASSSPTSRTDLSGLQDSSLDPRNCRIALGPWDYVGRTPSFLDAITKGIDRLIRFDRGFLNLPRLVLSAWSFSYGNCCGGQLKCSGNPADGVDCLDSACSVHDACLAGFSEVTNPATFCRCNKALCEAAKNCGCRQTRHPNECLKARQQVIQGFCVDIPRAYGC